ncbi:MAG: ABC transporter ATP-binding protein [Calditrichota bacterium]
MEASIALKNITKRYNDTTILRQVSFGIEKGTVLCLVGPGGSGKTTLLRILTGITHPDDGAIYIQGMALSDHLKEIRKLYGYLPEDNGLNPNWTLFRNLRLHGILYGMTGRAATSRIMELCEQFQVLEHVHDFPDELSPSIIKRATFIRTILHDPPILYLDEPTTGTDYSTKKRIWGYIQNHIREKTVLVTLRDLAEAERYADRIVVMDDGRIVTDGTPEKLLEDAARSTEYILQFKSATPAQYQRLKALESVVDVEQEKNTFTLLLKDSGAFDNILQEFKNDIMDYQVKKLTLNEVFFELPQIDQGT